MTTGHDCTWKQVTQLPNLMRWGSMYSYVGLDYVTKPFWEDGAAWSQFTFIMWYTSVVRYRLTMPAGTTSQEHVPCLLR